jgi:hypothetical protein
MKGQDTNNEHEDGDLAWLPGVQAAWLTADLVEPPIWVTQRAKRLLRPQAETSPQPKRAFERLRATLLFDSRQRGPAAAGVRAASTFSDQDVGPWQLLYRGGDVDVDLLVRPNQDGRTAHVRGQALSLAGASVGAGVVEALPADAPRRLRGSARPAVRSELQPSGEFALPNLERGRYDVLLRIGAREIELSDVEL